METTTTTPSKSSVLGLIKALTGDSRTFIRQEIKLAKTEISEKISSFGHNAVALAIGGFVAYAGLIVFLVGLGWLLAWVFQQLGLEAPLADFVGLAAVGLLVIIIGSVLLLTGIKKLSKQSIAPERTLQTLQDLKGSSAESDLETEHEEEAPSSAAMQARVAATEDRMGETLDELGHRLSPQHINAEVKQRIRSNPYRSGVIAMVAGLVSGLLLRRKFRHA